MTPAAALCTQGASWGKEQLLDIIKANDGVSPADKKLDKSEGNFSKKTPTFGGSPPSPRTKGSGSLYDSSQFPYTPSMGNQVEAVMMVDLNADLDEPSKREGEGAASTLRQRRAAKHNIGGKCLARYWRSSSSHGAPICDFGFDSISFSLSQCLSW